MQKEEMTKKAKAKSCLFACVSQMILIKIMILKSPKEIWKKNMKGTRRFNV